MAVKKKGLGRGLDALFPEKPAEKKPVPKPITKEVNPKQEAESVKTTVPASDKKEMTADAPTEVKKTEMLVKISKVEPNRTQPRKQFDEDALVELSESIKQFGILQPLLVSDKGDYYEIIAGERRWRAAKLAGLKFLDPACGSGNFLTETYLSLRRLENDILRQLTDQVMFGGVQKEDLIQVSIGQFYGIEINDFAVTVARTALWIAESQMMKETEDVVHMSLDFLPLRSYANITEGNALRLD